MKYAGCVRAVARPAFHRDGNPGRLCRVHPGRPTWRCRRSSPACAACRSGFFSGCCNLDNALRRHAGRPDTVSDRLSGFPDAALAAGLCSCRRCCRVCDQQRPVFPAAPLSVRVPDGRRYLQHALHRHDGAACERAYGARAALCHGEPGHRHCRIRFGALACDGGSPPTCIDIVVGRLRYRCFGMHYTAMSGMKLFPLPATSNAPALSADLLAIVVAVVAFCVSGIFLLVLVPDRTRGETSSVRSAPATTQTMEVAAASAPATAQPVADHEVQFGRGTYAPLGGAGGPPPRIAQHLPVERDGATQFIAVEDVVAVHANAHYTYVFNGTLKLFCPLAIGEVESRLDKNRFIRVHRSHIINIDRVIGHRRNGDSELVELTATDHYSVPVSRSRIGWLKSRISARAR